MLYFHRELFFVGPQEVVLLNVLVMDDEPEIVSILNEYLQTKGHRSRGIDSPATLLSLVGTGQYDAVFVDLVMPWANGLTLIAEIRAADPTISIFVISALADTRVAIAAAKQGADACFSKPIDFGCLSEALTELAKRVLS